MSDKDEGKTMPGPDEQDGPAQPGKARFGDLAELEREISRRLRSNQRFLDRFLDEDFVDDEGSDDEEGGEDDEEL